MDSSTIYKAPGKKTEDTPVCIITGCSAGGLGFSLTRALLTKSNSLSRSWIVIATGKWDWRIKRIRWIQWFFFLFFLANSLSLSIKVRDQKSLKTLQTLSINLPPHSVLVPYFLDITDRHSVSTFVRQVIHQYRRIDLLINNAATSLQGSIVELSMTGFRVLKTQWWLALALFFFYNGHLMFRLYGRPMSLALSTWSRKSCRTWAVSDSSITILAVVVKS